MARFPAIFAALLFVHYAAIQAELAEALLDDTFPDMIGFSVYELLNSNR